MHTGRHWQRPKLRSSRLLLLQQDHHKELHRSQTPRREERAQNLTPLPFGAHAQVCFGDPLATAVPQDTGSSDAVAVLGEGCPTPVSPGGCQQTSPHHPTAHAGEHLHTTTAVAPKLKVCHACLASSFRRQDGLRRVPEEYPMERSSCTIFPLDGEERPALAV